MTPAQTAMPVFAPLYTPGAERVRVRWLTVEFPIADAVALRVLPRELPLPAEPTAALWIADFIGAEFHSPRGVERRPDYLQGGVSLRCSGFDGAGDGAYAVETFVEGLNHGILGRELFGLPKKQARSVQLDEGDGGVRFGMTSAIGEELVSGETSLGPSSTRGALMPEWFSSHHTIKAIPSAEGSGYDICRLVEIPWQMTSEEAMPLGQTELRWHESDADPLHVLEPTGPVRGAYGSGILSIAFGRYLADVEPPKALGSPSWGTRSDVSHLTDQSSEGA